MPAKSPNAPIVSKPRSSPAKPCRLRSRTWPLRWSASAKRLEAALMQLIGRDADRRRIKSALADAGTRVIVVQGPSGAGKTALIEDVLAAERHSGAIIGCGKYAEGTASGAFVPVMQALSEATNNALELLYDPAAGTAALRDALEPQL